jgi:hypothetical protein
MRLCSVACARVKTVKTYATAADWLARESACLRKMARLLDTAGGRLSAVLTRCKAESASVEHRI